MGVTGRFIRVFNSDGGFDDIPVGQAGSALVSNGSTVSPSFQEGGGIAAGGFSYTQPWEKVELDRNGFQDFGRANFTAEFERTAAVAALGDQARGPRQYTSKCDIPWTRRV
jgi:hypothetical protein